MRSPSPLVAMPMAPPLESYPRLEYRGEDLRAVLRRCRCACGGEAVLLSGELLPDAAARHNASERHQLYRASL